MKLLYVLHQDPNGYPAGIEQHLFDLVNGLSASNKYEISLFFPRNGKYILREVDAGKKEIEFKGPHVPLEVIKNEIVEEIFNDILVNEKIDIVHFQSMRNLPLSLIEVAEKSKAISVMTIHEYFLWCVHFILLVPNFCYFESDAEKCQACLTGLNYKIKDGFVEYRRKYVKELLPKLDAIVAPSHYVRDLMLELFDMALEQKIVTIENGSNKRLFNQDLIQNKSESSAGPLNIGFVGNFLNHKGSKVFGDLLKEFEGRSDVKFFLFGNMYEKLEKHYDHLTIIGGYQRDQLQRLLYDYAIELVLLLSTVPETFSFTLSEVLLNKIPVISLDLGSLRERVSRYKVGFLVPHEDPVAHIKMRIEFILHNKTILSSFRENCKKAAKEVPDILDMVKAYDILYQDLLSRLCS